MSKTVLVADESVTIRSVAESLLRGEAYSVRSAADGQMALELARTERPDLVLVGEKLPGVSGAEICQALKADKALAGIPVVFMRTDRPGAAPPEADAVLTKPFSPQAFLDTVHGLLTPAGTPSLDITAPVNTVGLADELIDEALGIDDVGPQPAREMQVSRGTELVGGLEEPPLSNGADQPAFGALEEPGDAESGEASTVDPEPFEFSTQVGLEEHAGTTRDGVPRESDLDRALDMAFGELQAAGAPGPTRGPAPMETPASSLSEISLGDPEPPAGKIPPLPAQAEVAPAGFASLQAHEPEPGLERPHDYDWFIKEMEKESKSSATSPARPAPEPPRIEPVATDAPDRRRGDMDASMRQESTPGLPSAAGGPAKSTTGFELQAEELSTPKRGYDEFISEFRREIARLEGALPEEPARDDTDVTRHSASGRISLTDSGMTSAVPAAEIRRMGDDLIADVTQKIARELAAKIDAEAIYSLIEQKLREQGKR